MLRGANYVWDAVSGALGDIFTWFLLCGIVWEAGFFGGWILGRAGGIPSITAFLIAPLLLMVAPFFLTAWLFILQFGVLVGLCIPLYTDSRRVRIIVLVTLFFASGGLTFWWTHCSISHCW
ncbi:MAG: hypothetical protein WCI73_16635 [Phycisphaerae bacterium]